MITLTSLENIKKFSKDYFISVVIFSTHTCSVCKPLKIKIGEVLKNYEKVGLGEIYTEEVKTAKGEYAVFTAPIVLVFVEGREAKRYSAAIDLLEFEATINRYCEIN